MSFESEADARALMDHARQLTGRAVNVDRDRDGAEISFCERERCRHDEGLPCEVVERVEVAWV